MSAYYQILGVDTTADDEALRDAYRQRVKEVHPDQCDHPDAATLFQVVREAYTVLTEFRDVYDDHDHETFVERYVDTPVVASDEYLAVWNRRESDTGNSMEWPPERERRDDVSDGWEDVYERINLAAEGDREVSFDEPSPYDAVYRVYRSREEGTHYGSVTAAFKDRSLVAAILLVPVMALVRGVRESLFGGLVGTILVPVWLWIVSQALASPVFTISGVVFAIAGLVATAYLLLLKPRLWIGGWMGVTTLLVLAMGHQIRETGEVALSANPLVVVGASTACAVVPATVYGLLLIGGDG